MEKKISIDELLTSQSRAGLRATLTAVDGQPEMVKVTPYLPGKGCQCRSAIKVLKTAIEDLTTTDETHACCGKILRVVEVSFKKDASVPVASLIEQMTAAKLEPDDEGMDIWDIVHLLRDQLRGRLDQIGFGENDPPTPPPIPPRVCQDRLQKCLSRAFSAQAQCECFNRFYRCRNWPDQVQNCDRPNR